MKHCFYRKYSLLLAGVAVGAMMVGTMTSASGQVPVGGSGANVSGVFGPVVNWPLIPLHMCLLSDGRVMSYGTDANGNQGGQFIYDVWNPALGTGTNAHSVLPNRPRLAFFAVGSRS